MVASGPHGPVSLRVTGEVVLSPEITNEQTELGSGAVMTMDGAAAVSGSPHAAQRVPREPAQPG